MLVYNSTDPNSVYTRLAWLRCLLRAKLPLTLYIDSIYQGALTEAAWYSEEIHPDVLIVPWSLDQSETWALCEAYSPGKPLGLPAFRSLEKDGEFFLALMNAKTELVARVAEEVEAPFVAFLDAGIAKIFREKEASFERLKNLELRTDFTGVLVPGCWPPAEVSEDDLARRICWMFCGGFFVVPRREAAAFGAEAMEALEIFLASGRITWEVNVWVQMMKLPSAPKMIWYAADHNDRMSMIPEKYRTVEG
jgi:hypothetical protein